MNRETEPSGGARSGSATNADRRARSPAFANAYAVSYRLLGVRDMSTELARSVASDYVSRESDPPSSWLPDLVSDAIDAAVALGGRYADELAGAEQSTTREALRRRLGGADGETRAAVGLHHLAGYPIERTAELTGADPSTVEELCAPFGPPPGVTWASLGDPLSRTAGRVSRRGRRRRRVPLYPLAALAVVVILAVWAATSVGERPSLGETAGDGGNPEEGSEDGDPVVEPGGALFEPTLNPLASAGCALDPAERTVFAEAGPGAPSSSRADLEGVSVSYRVLLPDNEDPAPLVVTLIDEGADPADFQGEAQLEDSLPGSIHITAPSLVTDVTSVGAELAPRIVEDAISELCVDLSRVFVVGHGAGGTQAASVACADSSAVVGVAVVSAAPLPPEDCLLDPPAAVFVAARDDDPTVDTGEALAEVGNAWATLLGAESEAVEGVDERTLIRRFVGPGDVTVTTRNQTEGGHAWNSLDSTSVVEFVAGTARRLG